MKPLEQFEALLERANKPSSQHEHQLKRVQQVSNRMIDLHIMNALKARKRSLTAVAKHLRMTEQNLMNNLNPELFTTCDTGLGNITIGFTPKALNL